MILFWLICALFIVIAFAFIMPTAMQRNESSQQALADERKLANIAIYRDQLSELEADLQNGIVSQDQYTQDRDEIERRLLEDTAATSTVTRKTANVSTTNKNTAYAIGFILPVAAVIFYLSIGSPKAVTDPTGGVSATRSAPTGERTQEQIDANVAALANRLKENPSDAQGWAMLARSYNSMSRFGEAAGAYAKATELQPNNADLLAEYAFVSAMANQQRLDGLPTELINQALKADPENAKALQLAGSAAFQAKDYKKAIAYWERVLKKVESDSEVAQLMTERINEAKSLAANNK
jgi:cytochrome c-type biogenesis protein CcmH